MNKFYEVTFLGSNVLTVNTLNFKSIFDPYYRNKKSELMLTRRAKAYSSSGSVV